MEQYFLVRGEEAYGPFLTWTDANRSRGEDELEIKRGAVHVYMLPVLRPMVLA